jgi:hypothetical protein
MQSDHIALARISAALDRAQEANAQRIRPEDVRRAQEHERTRTAREQELAEDLAAEHARDAEDDERARQFDAAEGEGRR